MIDNRWFTKPPDIPTSLAAGGVVVRWIGKTLHVALVKEADFDEYILPKGRVEVGETLEMAAAREIEEEAGLKHIQLITKLGVCERMNFRRTAWKVTHYFLYLTEEEGARPSDTTHRYLCKWFTLNNLPVLFWPDQKKLLVDKRDEITRLLSE